MLVGNENYNSRLIKGKAAYLLQHKNQIDRFVKKNKKKIDFTNFQIFIKTGNIRKLIEHKQAIVIESINRLFFSPYQSPWATPRSTQAFHSPQYFSNIHRVQRLSLSHTLTQILIRLSHLSHVHTHTHRAFSNRIPSRLSGVCFASFLFLLARLSTPSHGCHVRDAKKKGEEQQLKKKEKKLPSQQRFMVSRIVTQDYSWSGKKPFFSTFC